MELIQIIDTNTHILLSWLASGQVSFVHMDRLEMEIA